MGRITDQLTELIQRIEESDRRLKQLIDNHVDSTSQRLEELKRLNKE
jgi:ferritin-like metal-binding protein YciE